MKTVHYIFIFALILGISIAILNQDEASGWWFIGVCIGIYGLANSLIKYFNDKKLNGKDY